ncbi:PTS sugar transporter subunit IIA [Desulfosarcina ovata]|uniref:MerR family transcriptional regulator n=2 Tax=Desulfosarcina ovata TaxID=83564 RepID=A0A5K8A8P2_9BACT|nr:PTS sugar transporter subunit IIA [Desulfosarcina ovata]BBO81670.1 MerR family transcriptional regulator [Desulfosarcina ovata subsp. sediminis]BBO88905.1 MerR family transcriptional regulator [Desulfosarcina ovata subsp. ovata]
MKLSMKTVAGALDLPVSTLERWIRQGRIPIQRSGRDVIFAQPALEKWAATHNLPFSLDETPPVHLLPAPLESLASAMQRGKVYHHVDGQDATSALKSAVACMDVLPSGIGEELFNKLIEREQLASTGIGNGIAIPHPRDPLSQPPGQAIISTCFLERPVDFNAIDDRPVFVLFLLISPTVKLHLHLLSRLSYCIRDREFVRFLKAQPEAAALFSRVSSAEMQLDDI